MSKFLKCLSKINKADFFRSVLLEKKHFDSIETVKIHALKFRSCSIERKKNKSYFMKDCTYLLRL